MKDKPKGPPSKGLSLPVRFFLPALSALACTASFPSVDLWPLAWIGLAPLLMALAFTRGASSFGAGMLFGFLHAIGLTYWVFNALYYHAGVDFFAAILFLILVIGAFMSLYYGLFAIAAARVIQSDITFYAKSLYVAAAWVFIEFLRSNLFSGFPWDLLGHSQYRWLQLIQIVDITGVYGISFLLVFTNCCLYQACRSLAQARTAVLRILPAIALITVSLLYGLWRLAQFPAAGGPELR